MKTHIFLSDSYNPLFNLALEDYLLRTLTPEEQILFLWRNQHTVVIGRSQNPWAECHLEHMQEDNVTLVRRQSGGGAVYHDLGNTNFTFISPKQDYCPKKNINIIVKALQKLGINTYPGGRNDLLVEQEDGIPRKVSGSAYRQLFDRAFHHGTLLVNSDLSLLSRYLTPKQKKLEAKGVKSVRARVANLNEFDPTLSHERLLPYLMDSFSEYYQQPYTAETLSESLMEKEAQIHDYYQELLLWDWQYGKTLPFTHHLEDYFPWGSIDIHLEVKQGIIHHVDIFSDCLFPDFIEAIQKILKDLPYSHAKIHEQLDLLKNHLPNFHKEIEDVKELLSSV